MTKYERARHEGSANFNSHAHVERDIMPLRMVFTPPNFNSHAHVERDSVAEYIRELSENFNSHAHVERDEKDGKTKYLPTNFNSHAHVERDDLKSLINSYINISTHTLTWSVTAIKNPCYQCEEFQLTRSRGA